ncbi:MutS-related protein [Solitalea canadensis]|uniref:Mismatch repair ATPase (MutS family) n=1 Tax=Solitalea canadensis (strain ATCC 29591 / DSM 3403 / JCM 21819 / LMG 8368 / NBRC 15130 / NCIMB 12057 / USAM 9D) TaxID=929556 RepID=H8KM72_SOLCM|nr:mismatch repair ATPase [Solitalea canadensis]AFD09254.1 mismatch repair ATPase (MutS family) [Solitalea canadensis DSM 3403]
MATGLMDQYNNRITYLTNEIQRYSKLVNNYSLARLATIIGGFLFFFLSLQYGNPWISSLIAFTIIFLFAWLVSKQSKYEGQKDYLHNLKSIIENEVANKIFRTNIYDDGERFMDDHHHYTSDLDIFGNRSLFHFINRCSTFLGNNTLANWFKAPTATATVTERQSAIKEIASKDEWRTHFQAVLLFNNKADNSLIDKLVNYINQPVVPMRILRFYVISIAPFLFLGVLIFSSLNPSVSGLLIILSLIHLAIVFRHQLYVNKTDALIGKTGKTLGLFSAAFKAIEDEKWNTALCTELSNNVNGKENHRISGAINQLSALIKKLDYRLNIYVGIVLNSIFLWDLRQVFAIEDWKTQNKAAIGEAFEHLAVFEALNSLAAFEVNHPENCYPEVVESEKYLYVAEGISHPLIDQNIRVANDYELSNENKIDIITGSNMAGKSTFLRTLGVNAVLALSGASVVAKTMKLSPINLVSYMRIRDSLNESTSTFKAELDRLQMILEVVKDQPQTFFLIDEMLRGTNSVDKYRGSKAVVEKLVAQNGVGIVATHDLQIAHLIQKYPDYVRNFYFDIQVENDEMHFDYKFKKGECKTFNASLLLKQIGIEVE